MDILFTETNLKTVKLLSECGFEVIIPDQQNCCGALHAHSGEMASAKEMAKKNVKVFYDAGVDYIVTNAGGCGAMLIEYDQMLKDDPEYAEISKWFAGRVKDVAQMIVDAGRIPDFAVLPDTGGQTENNVTISYQDSCHLLNGMKQASAPRQLMKSVANATYIEQKEAGRCCGSAGIYNLTQPEMSGQVLDHKMVHVKNTQARYLLHSNPGCLLQMKLGIEKHGMSGQMKALHLVDFLYDHRKR